MSLTVAPCLADLIDRYRRAVERYEIAVNAARRGNPPDRYEKERRAVRAELFTSGWPRIAELLDAEFAARYALRAQLECEETVGSLDDALARLRAARRAVEMAASLREPRPVSPVPMQRHLWLVR